MERRLRVVDNILCKAWPLCLQVSICLEVSRLPRYRNCDRKRRVYINLSSIIDSHSAANDLDEPVPFPEDLFEQVWPLVSSVCTFRNRKLQQKGTIEVEHGECRLKKSRKSSSAVAKPGSSNSKIKRRDSTIREKYQYLVTVKLTHQITGSNPTVTLGRKGEHKYSHPLETSFGKKSKQVQELINKKTVNNYSAAQIFHAIRGAGTEASTSLLDAAGGKMQA